MLKNLPKDALGKLVNLAKLVKHVKVLKVVRVLTFKSCKSYKTCKSCKSCKSFCKSGFSFFSSNVTSSGSLFYSTPQILNENCLFVVVGILENQTHFILPNPSILSPFLINMMLGQKKLELIY